MWADLVIWAVAAGLAATCALDWRRTGSALGLVLMVGGGIAYQYYSYGDTPMTIARFPIYWLFINTTGPVLCAAILYAVPGYFTGWRKGLLVLLPVVADASCSIAVGLPVYTVLHTESVGAIGRWAGVLLTVFIGLVLLDGSAGGSCTAASSWTGAL